MSNRAGGLSLSARTAQRSNGITSSGLAVHARTRKSSAVGLVLLREVGWAPAWATWVRRAARFRNRVVKRGQGDLVRAALVEICEVAAAGGSIGGPTHRCWAAHMAAAVRKLGEGLGKDWRLDVRGMAVLPTAMVRGTKVKQLGSGGGLN